MRDKMRKLLFILFIVPVTLCAQNVEFGCFSLEEVMDSLPEYKAAQDEYNLLLERCDSEIARGEEELTRCYVSFLDGQNTFPEPILLKRQKELQDLVDRSIILRDQLKDWLVQAHDSLFTPITQKIDQAVERVCLRNNYAYAIDTDKAAYRYVNPNFGVNITALVIQEVLSPQPIETVVDEAVDAVAESTEEVATEQSAPAEEQTTDAPVIEIVTQE